MAFVVCMISALAGSDVCSQNVWSVSGTTTPTTFSGTIPFYDAGTATTYDWVQLLGGGTLDGPVDLGSGGDLGTLEFSGDSMTLGSGKLITGDGSVVVSTTTGTITFAGANTYAGGSNYGTYGTLVDYGTLVVTTGGVIDHATRDLYIADSGTAAATLRLTGGSVTARDILVGHLDAGSLTVSSGTLTTSVSGTSGGSLIIGAETGSAGTATISGGTVQVASAIVVALSGTGTLSITGGGVTAAEVAVGVGNAGTLTVGGTGTLTSTGNMLVGYGGTGTLTVNSGGKVTVGGELSGAGDVTIGSGGVLQIGDGGATGTLVTSGTVTDNGQVIFFSTGTSALDSSITGSGSVVKQGTGTLTINSGNDYAGGTSVEAGSLVIGQFGVVSHPSGAVSVSSGATLDVKGLLQSGDSTVSGAASVDNYGTWTTRNLAASGSVVVDTNGTLVSTGTVTTSGTGSIEVIAGTLSIGNGGSTGHLATDVATSSNTATVAFFRSGTDSFSSAIHGSGGVNVISGTAGPLTLTISGTSDYTGGTVVGDGATAATLYVNGALGETAVQVNAGSRLGGTGSIAGSVAVAETGILSPGTLSQGIGTLTVGSLAMTTTGTATGSTVEMTVSGTSTYDQVVALSGTSTISYAGTLALDFNGTNYANYTVFHLFKDFDTNNVSGQLDGITLSGSNDFTGLTFDFDQAQGLWLTPSNGSGQYLEFNQNTGNLVVVPEPSTLLMAAAAFGAMGLAWGKRKRDQALAGASSKALTTVGG